ncbi:MAG: hypothetical protein E7051_10035 [Lentisphaerae bacterium]|nr:hypothetical protein [Lentisphaerota bacterium]
MMTPSADILLLSGMLDDPDDRIGVGVIARLLQKEDELGDLPAMLQESSDPVIRRRAHWLQHALNMRIRRRRIREMLEKPLSEAEAVQVLVDLHLLWFDKDIPAEIGDETEEFVRRITPELTDSLDDTELLMRKLTLLPESETTVRPESYCIGTVIRQRAGAATLICALFGALLQKHGIVPVRVAGNFGLMDSSGNLLASGGSWHLAKTDPDTAEVWQPEKLLRYIALTLFSCSVNSDSYRYVMSFAQTLSGDETPGVFDKFPYPFTIH